MRRIIYKSVAALIVIAMILCDNSIVSLANEIVPENEKVFFEEDSIAAEEETKVENEDETEEVATETVEINEEEISSEEETDVEFDGSEETDVPEDNEYTLNDEDIEEPEVEKYESVEGSTNGHTPDSAIALVSSWAGQAIDVDGYFGAQCVDLIMKYYLILGQNIVGGNACDYATNALPSGWKRYQGGTPQKGDILIWTNGEYGHVAIYESDYSTWHQNYSGQYVEQRTGYYQTVVSNYWGCIHPDFVTNHVPTGYVDYASGGKGTVTINGWASDSDSPTTPVSIRLYVGGKCYSVDQNNKAVKAGNYRADHNQNVGYEATFKVSERGNQTIKVVAIDNEIGAEAQLTMTSGVSANIYIDEEWCVLFNENDIAHGYSNDIIWVVNANGKLIISGTGDWKRESEKYAPWYKYRTQIKSADVVLSKATNLSYFFADCTNLSSVNLLNLVTSGVRDMSYMFDGCSSLASLDVSDFDTSQVVNIKRMFNGCSGLTSLNLGNFDPSNALSMWRVFYGCSSLSSLDLSSFGTSSAVDMTYMFYDCSSLTSLDLKGFDTLKVGNMSHMFHGCSNLQSVDVSSFKTSVVTDMNNMFHDCTSLSTLELSGFDTSSVTDMSNMFYNCSSLTALDVSDFNTAKVSNMGHMFFNCSSLAALDVSDFNTSEVLYMDNMFGQCAKLKALDLSNFDTSKVLAISDILNGCSDLIKIVSPKTCSLNVELPVGKTWKDSDGNTYTKLPNISIALYSDNNVGIFFITYELNGGTNSKDNPISYGKGKTVTLKNPKKDGYTFIGWFNNATDEKVTTVKDKDITIYAKWSVNTYTITLNGNGGKYISEGGTAISVHKMNMTYDVSDTLKYQFVRSGYTLAGWTTKKDGKGTFYKAGTEVKNLTKTNKANVNLYAKWTANEYTISFDINAPEIQPGDLGGEMLPLVVKYGKSIKLPDNKYSRKGYTFKGWSLTPDGKVKYKNKADVKNLAVKDDVILHAVWSINTYSVKFNGNGGKGKAPKTVKGLQYGVKSLTLPENSFTNKDVYTFVGWNTKPNGLGVDYAVGDTVNLVATKNKQVFTLYPIWQYDLRVSTGDDKCIAFYTEYNWVINVNELVKSFEQIEPKVIKNGYYIAGFATSQKNADKGKITYKGSIKNVAGKILYPVYKVNKYTIKFDANGGTGKMKNVTATYDKDVTLPKNAFKNGSKTFLGWATSSSSSSIEYGNKEVVKNLSNENKGVVKLYAVWGD